jgi:hypothetical protein
MRVGSRAHFTTPPVPLCVVCNEPATTTIVPTRGTRVNRENGTTVHVTTMRLCAPCRFEVVSGRVTLGWSWRAERWGRLGTTSPEGDRYLRHPG